jgi:hypothetical protein
MLTCLIKNKRHIVKYLKTFTLLLTLIITGCNSKELNSKPIVLTSKNLKTTLDNFNKQDASWSQKTGTWVFENGVLKQTSTKNHFPLILLEKEKFSDVDISVDFKPISGRIDASGGIVFRAVDKDNYYIVRANALENNYRLYTFIDGSRSQIATATVKEPSLKEFHTMRIVAKGDHIQAYLDGKLYIDHHDNSFTKGFTGLWTKADSVTEFDNFKVVGE